MGRGDAWKESLGGSTIGFEDCGCFVPRAMLMDLELDTMDSVRNRNGMKSHLVGTKHPIMG